MWEQTIQWWVEFSNETDITWTGVWHKSRIFYYQPKKCVEKINFSWDGILLPPGTEVRAKWKVVVERDAIWVILDFSVARRALLTVTSAHLVTTQAEDDSVSSSSPYVMQKFTIFPSYSFLFLTKFRLSPKGTNKGKKCFTAFSPRYCFGVHVRWDQVSATRGAFLIHCAVCGQTRIWLFIAFWTEAQWSECRRHSHHISWALATQSQEGQEKRGKI